MRKELIIFFSISSLLLIGFQVQAIDNQANKEALKEKILAQREASKLKSCDVVEGKIERKFANYQTKHQTRLESFQKTKEKLERFINKAEEKGYQVDTLKVDLVTFDSKIEKYRADYNSYLNLLRDTKQFTCGKSEGEFKAKLTATRDQLKLVQQDAVEIRTFFAKTFKPHLLDLKTQKVAIEGEEEKEGAPVTEGVENE